MKAARARGESRSDWTRVRRKANADTEARTMNRKIGELVERIERKRGRPVEGEPKRAVSLRIPESTISRWKATGPGWQTRMVQALNKAI
ncbi:BrnA antitoxin family protein [Fontimonas sp. SYSU GA230001]|uniref:BrnA antitoxin family protein n=1 Tax=Fontimonas sp. SYSU GA230001 TaxID=3142450 RepID=UPI0032B4E5C0